MAFRLFYMVDHSNIVVERFPQRPGKYEDRTGSPGQGTSLHPTLYDFYRTREPEIQKYLSEKLGKDHLDSMVGSFVGAEDANGKRKSEDIKLSTGEVIGVEVIHDDRGLEAVVMYPPSGIDKDLTSWRVGEYKQIVFDKMIECNFLVMGGAFLKRNAGATLESHLMMGNQMTFSPKFITDVFNSNRHLSILATFPGYESSFFVRDCLQNTYPTILVDMIYSEYCTSIIDVETALSVQSMVNKVYFYDLDLDMNNAYLATIAEYLSYDEILMRNAITTASTGEGGANPDFFEYPIQTVPFHRFRIILEEIGGDPNLNQDLETPEGKQITQEARRWSSILNILPYKNSEGEEPHAIVRQNPDMWFDIAFPHKEIKRPPTSIVFPHRFEPNGGYPTGTPARPTTPTLNAFPHGRGKNPKDPEDPTATGSATA